MSLIASRKRLEESARKVLLAGHAAVDSIEVMLVMGAPCGHVEADLQRLRITTSEMITEVTARKKLYQWLVKALLFCVALSGLCVALVVLVEGTSGLCMLAPVLFVDFGLLLLVRSIYQDVRRHIWLLKGLQDIIDRVDELAFRHVREAPN